MTAAGARSSQKAWQVASVLLGYPDEVLISELPVVRAAIGSMPDNLAEPFRRHLAAIEGQRLLDLAAHYSEVFDHKRRCCLYLTYYAHGDTRKRGMALLAFKRTYAEAGLTLGSDELPDHLAVVLEYAATVDEVSARRMLLANRAGIGLLRLALADAGSPYVHVLEAVSATLPPLRGDERQAVARLAAEGPPAEQVGLAPFEPPSSALLTEANR